MGRHSGNSSRKTPRRHYYRCDRSLPLRLVMVVEPCAVGEEALRHSVVIVYWQPWSEWWMTELTPWDGTPGTQVARRRAGTTIDATGPTPSWRRPHGAVCDNPVVRADELDEAVWKEVLVLLENPQLIQCEINRRLAVANDTGVARRRTDALHGELARIETRLRRLLDAYQEEVITLDELRERKSPLQTRQQSIVSELKALQTAYSGEADHRFRREADHPVRASRSPVGAKRRGGSIMPFSDRLGSIELSSFASILLST